MTTRILLIGCGNMGQALLNGWLRSGMTVDVTVVEPSDPLRSKAEQLGAKVHTRIDDVLGRGQLDFVVVAVKPQTVPVVLFELSELINSNTTVVSVAAGVSIESMSAALPRGTPIVRCMPNTPAAIGQGMLVFSANVEVSYDKRDTIEKLFSSVGATAWVADEGMMDAVTAISGSGPAYVFHFVEALIDAGTALGLPHHLAEVLAKQTVAGAARMAQDAPFPLQTLREQVTSPGGTTAAALSVLMTDQALSSLVARAAIAARDRSFELGRAK